MSAAGIAIRSPAAEILPLILHHAEELLSGMRRYRAGFLDLWVTDGLVSQIGLYSGYQGRLAKGIGIGSTVVEIERALGKVGLDGEGNRVVRGSPGWCFEVEERRGPPGGPKSLRQARVTGIYVFPSDI